MAEAEIFKCETSPGDDLLGILAICPEIRICNLYAGKELGIKQAERIRQLIIDFFFGLAERIVLINKIAFNQRFEHFGKVPAGVDSCVF